MKKFLCLVLSLLITLSSLSVLGVVTIAADENGAETEGEVVAENELIGFEPAAEHKSYYSPYRYTGGEWVCTENADTDEWFYKYEYDFYDIHLEGNELTFKTPEGFIDTFVCTDGKFVNGDDILDETKLSVEPSERKGEPYIKITYGDSVYQYEIKFADAGISEIVVENAPYELKAYIDGSYKRLAEGNNGGDVAFCYKALRHQGAAFTVSYENGEKEVFTYSAESKGFVDENGAEISAEVFSYTDSQSFCEWQPDGEYYIDCYYKGERFMVDYKILSNPVKAIEYVQAEIPQYKENEDGEKKSCNITDCEDCDGTYFDYAINRHFPVQGDKIKVTYSDDTVAEYVSKGNSFVDDENNALPKTSMVCHNDQSKKHWPAGENKFIFELYGYETELTANVTANGITSVQFAPVRVYENNFGHWESDTYIYDKAHCITGSNFTISFTDGTTEAYYYDKESDSFIDEDGNAFDLTITVDTAAQLENPWTCGKNVLPVDISGFEAEIEVNIVKNPVAAIAFLPADTYIFELEKNGYWSTSEDVETGEIKQRFIYDISDCSPYTDGNMLAVQYTNGKIDIFTYDEEKGKFINEKGSSTSALYDIEYTDLQLTYPWSIEEADNNFIGVTFMGVMSVVRVVLDNGEKPVAATVGNIEYGDGYVRLYWNNVANAEKYVVYKRAMNKDGKFAGKWEKIGETTECGFQDAVDSKSPYYNAYFIHTQNKYGPSTYDASKDAVVRYVPEVSGFKVASAKKGVSIKWDAFDGNIKLYRRAAGETAWTYLAMLDGNKKAVVDPNVKSGTYYVYKAVRVDGANESAEKQSALIKHLATPHLNSIKNVENGIEISWSKVDGATGYRVYRRAAGEKYFKLIRTVTTTSFCDTGVKSTMGKYYKYTVKAVSGKYLSECEDGLLLQRNVAPQITSATNTSGGIVVKWNKLNNATEYKVYRRGAGQTAWTYIGTTKNLQYFDSKVANASGNYYRYTVRAMFGKTYGSFDTNGIVILRLGVPEITRVRNDANGVKVEFSAVKGAAGYYVYHRTGKSSWVRVGTTTKTTFVDSNVTAGQSYVYAVKAYRGSYMSDFKATSSAHLYVPAPGMPTPVNEANGVRVTWYEVPMAEKYYVGRCDNGGEWKTIKVFDKSEVKKDSYGQLYYIDTTAVDGKTYGYSVRAYAKNTTSGYFENRFITYYAPVDVLSAKSNDKGITVTWEKSPKAAQYILLRKAEGENGYQIYENGITGTSFTDEAVTSGKTYSYKVWAVGGPNGKTGMSAGGAVKSCKAK